VIDADTVCVPVTLSLRVMVNEGVRVRGGVIVGVCDEVALEVILTEADRVGVRVRGGVMVGVGDAVADKVADAEPDAVGVGVFGGVTVPVAVPLIVCEVVPLGDMEPVLVGGGVRDAVADIVAVALTDCDADSEGVRVRGGVTVDV
jgi:hypothetical protein